MMLLLLCVLLCMGTALGNNDEETVSALFGAHGDNRCAVCVGGSGRRCVGALWRERWAVATASCLQAARPSALLVVRDLDALTCDDAVRKKKYGGYAPSVRSVLARLAHPAREHRGLVLLPLDRPFTSVDNLANSSAVHRALQIVEPWKNIDIDSYQVVGLSAYPRAMISTPLRMMFTTILLPIFSFLAFFMFVVFCTGREPIPYQSLDDKSESNYGV